MDYEKAYKDALERAKKNYDVAQDLCNGSQIGVECFKNTLTNIFPELAESENERIRKALINVFATHKDYEMFFGVSVEDIRDWLEKQDKYAIACSKEQMKVLNEVLNFAANHESPYWNDYIFGTLSNLIRQLKKLKYKEV